MEKDGKTSYWVLADIFSILSFLYFFTLVDPRLIYEQQQPCYFLGFRFFRGFLSYPGGLADYASAFVSQFFMFRFAGAAILSAVATAILLVFAPLSAVLTRPYRAWLIVFLPSLLILVFHANYWFPLSITIAILFALSATLLFLRIRSISPLLRSFFFGLLSAATYWFAGGQVFLFATLCALYEALVAKKLFTGILFWLFAVSLPCITYSFLTIITFQRAFFNQSPFYFDFKPVIAPYLFYAIVFLMTPLGILFSIVRKSKLGNVIVLWRPPGRLILATRIVVLIVLTAAAAGVSFNPIKTSCVTMDFLAHNELWTPLTAKMHAIMSQNNIAKLYPLYQNRFIYPFYVNRALFHRGILLDSMFAFWQLQPPVGMLTPNDLGERFPLFCSSVYFDLALVNASQRWAYEAYATSKTPRVLRRLVKACLAAGQTQDAGRCCEILKGSLFDREWARHYAGLCSGDSGATHDVEVDRVRSAMPETDFVMHGIGEGQNLDLTELFNQKKNNVMAFEYCMANFLLTYQLDSVASYFRYFEKFKYPSIPRHVEEALVFLDLGLKKQTALGNYRIRVQTQNRFRDFMHILMGHNGDMRMASKDLFEHFGDTYWFYLYSAKPVR